MTCSFFKKEAVERGRKTDRDTNKDKGINKDAQGNTIYSTSWILVRHGVTVSMSAFLACHQCYCAGSSLAWGLNLRALVCGIF